MRGDLTLMEGMVGLDGSPTWTVYDPLRNRYFRIGWDAFQLLSRWGLGTAKAVLEAVRSETTFVHADESDVEKLMKFLFANNLTVDSPTGKSEDFLAQSVAGKSHWLKQLSLTYLFFRIPLIRPDAFLTATGWLVAFVFTRGFTKFALLTGIIGLYLTSRQWDEFVNTFLYFHTPSGFALYGTVLVLIKIAHEFGHGYTAKRYGCCVPTMGLAFLVMFPVLYTDTSDVWKLTVRRERLRIGAAGIITELYFAIFATAAWSFLPDGTLRSLAFVVATTSWITTVLINFNPFLRFDGYYLLSDAWGIHNLQTRAFALGRWRLRRLVFGVEEDPPERFPTPLKRRLVVYAWAVWIYRFFFFLGIAVFVYYFFFKVLGVVLFLIEIAWFIAAPIARELRVWWSMRMMPKKSRLIWLASLGGLAVWMAVTPWNTRVVVPAVHAVADHTTIYAPTDGRVQEVLVVPGSDVTEGQVLVRLLSPSLEHEVGLATQRLSQLRLRAKRHVTNVDDLSYVHVLNRQIQAEEARLVGLAESREKMELIASLSGVVTDVFDGLQPGLWVNEELPMMYIAAPMDVEIVGAVEEDKVHRLRAGQAATFIPDDPSYPTTEATVVEIGGTDKANFDNPYLASVYGGRIPVVNTEQGLIPESSVYEVRFSTSGKDYGFRAVRGVVHVKGQPQSLIYRVWRLIGSVFIRESGF